MKKVILTISVVAGFSAAGFAQGILVADNSNGGNPPAYDVTINGVKDTTTDINLELLYSSSATTSLDAGSGLNILASGSPVVTFLQSATAAPSTGTLGQTYSDSGIISTFGTVYDGTGTEFTLPAGTYDFQILGWTGNYNTLDAAAAAGQAVGATSVFSATAAASPALPADVSGMGILNLAPVAVPEPTTLAMAGVGLASMLIFRRKK